MHIYLIQTYEMVKMLAMRKKLIVYLIILLNLLSCDASYPLLVEGRSKYNLSEDCGVVDIYGTSALSDWVEMDIDGNFVVFPDSLRLKTFMICVFYVFFVKSIINLLQHSTL